MAGENQKAVLCTRAGRCTFDGLQTTADGIQFLAGTAI